MASGQIKRSEIAEQDLYKEIRDSAKKTIQTLDKLNVELKKTGQVIKSDLSGSMEKTTAGINKMSKAVAKADQAMKASVNIDKEKAQATKAQIQAERELEKLQQDKERTQQAQMRTQTQMNREKERQIKLQQKQAKQAKDEADAYKQLVRATRDQKNESKRLGAELLKLEQAGKRNTKEYRTLQKQYDKVTASAKRGDQQLKKLDRTVGDNFRNVGNYRSALGKLTGALSSLGLAFGSAMVFRNVFETVKNFDQAQANLASVLGVSRIEMQGLTEDAKEYGSTTRFTASEVANLQTEFAKLGFTQEEIRNVTSATLDLASATNTDLAESATIVGATVRGFGLATTETARVTDVMSKSFSSSSLDMQKFSTAMANVAPVAKNAGFTLEQTTALIGTLTDRGIDASTAGTGLRNVFLELTKKGLTFEEAMGMIGNATDANAMSLELFGKRGAVIGTILAENGLAVDELTAKLEDSTGATARMAQMQLDTLGGSLDLLKSAFEGYILKQNEAGGAGDALKSVIRDLADNLETILDVVLTLGRAFVTYKAITLLQVGANRLLASSFGQSIRSMGLMRGAIRGLGTAFQKLGGFIKNNLIGIALFAIMDMVRQWQKLNAILNTVAEAQDNVAESMHNLEFNEKQQVRTANELFEALKKTNAGTEERDKLMRAINSQYGTTLKNLESEIDFQKQLADAQKKVIDNIRQKTEMEKVRVRFELYSQEMARADFEVEKAERALSDFEDKGLGFDIMTALFDKFGVESKNDLIDVLNSWYSVQADVRMLLMDAEEDYNQMQIKMATANGTTSPQGGSGYTPPTGGGGGNNTKPYVDLTRKIQDENIKQIQDERNKEIEKAKITAERRKEDLKKLKTYRSQRKELIKEIEDSLLLDLEKINAKYDAKERAVEIKNIKANAEARVSEQKKLLNEYDDTFDNIEQRETINKKIDELEIEQIRKTQKIELENEKLTEGERRKIIIDSLLKIDAIVERGTKRRLEIQQRYLEQLNTAYEDAQKQEKLRLLKSNKDEQEIQKSMLNWEIKNLKQLIKDKKKIGVDTIDDEIQLEELKRKKIKGITDQSIASAKQNAQEQIQIVQSLTEAFNFFADERIKKIDEEIAKAEERYNTYASLAKNGNIQAQQSMAVEAKLIAEQNRKKEQMEKRKQRIQLGSDALQAYLRNSEDPTVQNPLLKTFTDITLLTQFIQNLPFFEDGTEDTGTNGRGVDGRGGFHAILHPNERVLTKKQNAMIGDISNDDLAQLALDHHNGKLTGIVKTTSKQNNNEVVKRLESLEKTIKNKPVTNIELERIIDGTMHIVKTTKKGNTKTYNRYRTQ